MHFRFNQPKTIDQFKYSQFLEGDSFTWLLGQFLKMVSIYFVYILSAFQSRKMKTVTFTNFPLSIFNQIIGASKLPMVLLRYKSCLKLLFIKPQVFTTVSNIEYRALSVSTGLLYLFIYLFKSACVNFRICLTPKSFGKARDSNSDWRQLVNLPQTELT